METILITGANGFLGQHLCRYFSQQRYRVVATGKGVSRIPANINVAYIDVDLTKSSPVQDLRRDVQADYIIHTAAMSKPDECNNNREACIMANVEATRHLLAANTAHFIYISTDFIFGENGPHAEDHEADPLNFYGETKLQAELLVKTLAHTNTIIRPVFIYGQAWQGMRGSFLHWVRDNLQQGNSIKVVNDQLRTPTFAPDICKGIHQIIKQTATGTYHLAGKDILSPYQMAVATAEALQLDASLIEPVTAATFPEPVKRAQRSGLRIDKAIQDLQYAPVGFAEGIRLTFGT